MKHLILILFFVSLWLFPFIGFSQYANPNYHFTGYNVIQASNNLINLQKDHFRLLAYQALYDTKFTYFTLMNRTAPGQIKMDDGTSLPGSLNRTFLTFGTGFGKNDGLFIGLSEDIVNVRGVNPLQEFPATEAISGQFFTYAGIKAGEVQVSGGILLDQGLSGINLRDQFTATETVSPDLSIRYLGNIFHASGAYLSISQNNRQVYNLETENWDLVDLGYSVQGYIQPLKAELPEKLGLPFLLYEEYASPALSLVDKSSSKTQENTRIKSGGFGSDDMQFFENIPGLRFRTEYKYQFRPTVDFISAELTARYFFRDKFEIGFRGIVYKQLGQYETSSDTFIQFGSPWGAAYSLSHSFNSPDNTTFLPISGIQVFGFKITYGLGDLSKPLIPMISRIREQTK